MNTNKLVRQHKVTRQVEPRKRGRLNPDYVNGWLDESNIFHEGNPEGIKRAVGRPKKIQQPVLTQGNALGSELEKLVNEEVNRRVSAFKQQVISNLNASNH